MKRTQLTTSRGSLTNACIIETNGKELLFSYQTLVGVLFNNTCYFQRDGLAGSVTTARHIKLWSAGRPSEKISETELQTLTEV
jgi:hypothetical protein